MSIDAISLAPSNFARSLFIIEARQRYPRVYAALSAKSSSNESSTLRMLRKNFETPEEAVRMMYAMSSIKRMMRHGRLSRSMRRDLAWTELFVKAEMAERGWGDGTWGFKLI